MTESLFIDWVDALSLMRITLDQPSVARLIDRTALRWSSPTETGIEIAAFIWKPAEGFTGRPRSAVVLVNPRIEPLYRVERIECLMWVATRCWAYYAYSEDSHKVLNTLGIQQSALYHPRTRWHHLAIRYHKGEVAASKFEDRPRCPVCRIHVATGHENPKIHDGCRDYVRNVYAPALRAQKAASFNPTVATK